MCVCLGGYRQEVPPTALPGQRLGKAGKGNLVPDLLKVQLFGVTTAQSLMWPEKP